MITGLATRLSSGVAAVLPDRVVGAAIRRVYPRVEPELARFTDFVPRGGTAVDVGAWYGPWTARLARRADQVVAVEPTPQLASHLRHVFPAVRVVEAAASDQVGTSELHVPKSGPAVGVSSLERGNGASVTVDLVTLDGLGLVDVVFIKLDVEGHELHALHGGCGTIRRDRPALLVEVEERIQPIEPIITLLGTWGYRGFVLPGDEWLPLADFDLAGHQRTAIARVGQSFTRRVAWPTPRYVNLILFRCDSS